MAFMLGNHLTFIDSFQFMSSSLDKLVSNLPKDDLIYTSKVFKGKRLNLMSQKGVYPYNFMDSFEKFNQRELPNKDQFYSILKDQHITDDEYDHANKVSGPAEPVRPLRPWSDQKSCPSWAKPNIFQSSGRTNNCLIELLFKWSDQSCTPSAAPEFGIPL